MKMNYAPVIKGTDAVGQLHFILTHPLRYAFIMIHDFTVNADKYTQELIGVLGWLDIPAFTWLVYAHAAILIGASLADQSGGATPSKWARILAALAFIGSMGLVFSLMYLWWAPVGSPTLPGMQGRYFTPLLPLLPAIFCLPGRKCFFFRPEKNAWVKIAMATWSLILIFDTLFRTITHYYSG
jgi:uncharacterized membrane protein